MKSSPANKQSHAGFDIVVTTGCPHSGWDAVLPLLQEQGGEGGTEIFAAWCDELFYEAGITDLLHHKQSVQPSQGLTDKAMALPPPKPGEQLLLADARNVWLLDFWGAMYPHAKFVLFYTHADCALAFALQCGIEPDQYLPAWQATNRRLIDFQRRNRNRSILLDAEAALNSPSALAEVCHRIGLHLVQINSSSSQASFAPVLERLLAGQFLRQQQDLKSLQMELEACAQPLQDEIVPELPQPMELYDGYRQGKERVEQLAIALQEQEKLATERQDQLSGALIAKNRLEAENDEASRRNQLLLLQLDQLQEELETTLRQKQQAEQNLEAHRVLQEQACQKLDELKRASGKERGQLVKARDTQTRLAVDRQAQLTDAQEVLANLELAKREAERENELLRLQLNQVQEELEHYFLKYQELSQEPENVQEVPSGQTEEAVKLQGDKASKPKQNRQIQDFARSIVKSLNIRGKIQGKKRRAALQKKKERELAKKKEEEAKLVRLLKGSGFFDETWYLAVNTDVAKVGVGPVEHYLRYGAKEGRNPSDKFDTKFYLATNRDVAAVEINPLVHYLKFGREEGRQPLPQGVVR